MEKGILAQLAIKLARQKNPEGRLTNEDIEEAMSELKSLIENLPSKSMMMDTTTGEGANIFRVKEAKGGRIGYQTGGVTEQRTLPPEFVEAAQKTFLTDLSRQAGIPTITTAVQQQPGETAEQFANRQAQAQQFQITKAGMAELAPQVAAQDPLQQQAATLAGQGIGSYQPFLQQAQTTLAGAQGLLGSGAGTGAGTISDFMSPFQSQVIDTTLAEFDRQRQIEEQGLRDQQAKLGVLGAGRAGVQLAEYGSGADRERALLQAGLQQQAFQDAVARRQQDFQNRFGIFEAQTGLAGALPSLQRADIASLGQVGAAQQLQQQRILDAQAEANRLQAFEPQTRLDTYGRGIAQLISGYPGSSQVSQTPNLTPLQTALGVAATVGGLFGGKKT